MATICSALAVAQPAAAEGILDVLARPHATRLQQLERVDGGERWQRIHAAFRRVVAASRLSMPVELVVVTGGLRAETLLGRHVVVSDAAGALPEGELLMLLGHELGHVALGHWQGLGALYRQYIPGEVRPETTDPVAAALGAAASQLSHRQEFEADAHGYALLRLLGFGIEHAHGLLLRQGVAFDNATHPATRRRLAQLRALDTQINRPDLATGEASSSLAATPATPP